MQLARPGLCGHFSRHQGHAHLSTTEVYLPLVVKDLRQAMGGRSYRFAGDERSARGLPS